MSCAYNCAKWLMFLFNFIFTLGGLAILIVGIIIHLQVKDVASILEDNVTFPSIALIVIGAIVFIIAFFGCCGAIRESHCMIVTFAMLLLTILVIQVAIAIFAFVKLKGIDSNSLRKPYQDTFNNYPHEAERDIINYVQSNLECCGVDSYNDWINKPNWNNTIPWSCCKQQTQACTPNQAYGKGCVDQVALYFEYAGKLLGGIAIGIAVIEFVGIIFALCLANSIRNAERRGYGV